MKKKYVFELNSKQFLWALGILSLTYILAIRFTARGFNQEFFSIFGILLVGIFYILTLLIFATKRLRNFEFE